MCLRSQWIDSTGRGEGSGTVSVFARRLARWKKKEIYSCENLFGSLLDARRVICAMERQGGWP